MDGRRFDALTAAFARRSSRRTAVRSASVALLGGVAGLRATTAHEATPAATPDGIGSTPPSLLFVQTATGGSFAPNLQAGIPAVEFGPAGGGHHGPEEWVSISSLARYRQTLCDFVAGLPQALDRPDGLRAVEGGLA